MKTLTTKGQKILYATAGLGVNLLNTMMGSYLCSALLVGGFGADAIPYQTYAQKDLIIPVLWAAFAFGAKILDGIIDLPMASFTDNLKTKWGRRRPAILGGWILMVIAYVLFTLIPNPSGATVLNTIYYGAVLCMFYAFYTLTMVTYYATFTEVVDNEADRNFISNVKAVNDIIYFIIGYVGVRALLNSINIRTVALIVLPLSLTMMIPIFLIKEESSLDLKEKNKQISLTKSLSCTFKNKPFIKWMICYSFMTFGVQLFLGGINEYFSFVGMNMILVMLAAFIPVPFTLGIYTKIMEKKGFAAAFAYTLITYSIGMIILFIAGMTLTGTAINIVGIIAGLFCALAIGALFSVAYSVPSQLAADEEEKTGVANSAMYFAVQGLFGGVAAGIATGIVLTALKGSESQGSTAMKYLTLIAAGGTLVALVLIFTLPDTLKKFGQKK